MKTSFKHGLWILAFALVLGSASARSQGTDIRGIVSDSLTSQRIPFANVVIIGTTRGAATNNAGFFLIPKVPPGEYQIAASVIGYRRKVLSVSVRPGRAIDVNFQVASMPVEKEEVLVTAARRREVTEINTSIHVLEPRELKLAPAIVQQDVFHSLKMLPGIVSTSDVSSRFYVRGGAGDQNLVLIDGMKIFNPFHALGVFSLFDPDILQNVEMYTGAFPAGYGGRLSSVVNMTSRDGRSDRLSAKASIDFLSSKIRLEGPAISGTTWMVNYRESLFSDTFRRIVDKNTPVSFSDLFFKFKAQFPSGAKADFSLLSASDELRYSDLYRQNYGMLSPEPDYTWRTSAASGSFSDLLGERVFIQVFAHHTSYEANRSASTTVEQPAYTSVKEPGLRAQATYYTDSQDLFFFGFDLSFMTIEYKPVVKPGVFSDVYNSFVDASAWVRHQARYDRLLLDLGFHMDFGSLIVGEEGIGAFQPRLNLSYEAFGNWKAKASIGIFNQRSITVNNEDDVMPIFDAWIKIPDNLPPERVSHIVLGLDGNTSETTSLNIQAYHKHYTSLVVYNRDKIDAADPDYIQGMGNSYGLELLLRSRISSIDLYATYTLSWSNVSNQGLEYPPRYDRRHHLNLLATIEPLKNLEITCRWEFGTGFPYTASVGYFDRLMLGNPFSSPIETETGQPYIAVGQKNWWRLPAYHRLDLSATFRFVVLGIKGSLGGQVINVYNRTNVFYFNRKTGVHTNMLRFFPSATLSLEY
jgi:hypothetical protein